MAFIEIIKMEESIEQAIEALKKSTLVNSILSHKSIPLEEVVDRISSSPLSFRSCRVGVKKFNSFSGSILIGIHSKPSIIIAFVRFEKLFFSNKSRAYLVETLSTNLETKWFIEALDLNKFWGVYRGDLTSIREYLSEGKNKNIFHKPELKLKSLDEAKKFIEA